MCCAGGEAGTCGDVTEGTWEHCAWAHHGNSHFPLCLCVFLAYILCVCVVCV